MFPVSVVLFSALSCAVSRVHTGLRGKIKFRPEHLGNPPPLLPLMESSLIAARSKEGYELAGLLKEK